MAILYPTWDAGPTNWSVAAWSLADDNAKDQPKPGAGDTVIFTANSGTIQMDESSAALLAFTLGGGTLDGNDGTQWVLDVAGNVTWSAGTATQVSLSLTGSGNVDWASAAQALVEIDVAAGVTATLTGNTYTKKLSKVATGVVTPSGAEVLFFHSTSAAGWWNVSGAVLCDIFIEGVTASPGAGIELTNKSAYMDSNHADDRAITMDGAMDLGTGGLRIKTNTAGKKYSVTMGGTNLTCGAITLGDNNSSGSGVLNLGVGTHSIASVAAGHADNTQNAIDFATCTLSASGNITLDDIVATSAAADITASNFDIGTDGSLTMSDDLTLTSNLEVDGGTLDFGVATNKITHDGDAIYTSGTVSNAGILAMVGSGDVSWNSWANRLAELDVAIGVTATLTNHAFTKKLSNHGTITTGTSKALFVYPDANSFWAGTDSAVGVRTNIANSSNTPGATIEMDNEELRIWTDTTKSITMDGDIDTGTGAFRVYGAGAGDVMTVDMNGNNLTCGAFIIGDPFSATTGSGILDLGSGIHTITSIAAGNAANSSNSLDFSTAGGGVILSGTFDGSDITCLGPAAGKSIFWNGGGVPVIQDAAFDNSVYANNMTISDAENVNVLPLGEPDPVVANASVVSPQLSLNLTPLAVAATASVVAPSILGLDTTAFSFSLASTQRFSYTSIVVQKAGAE